MKQRTWSRNFFGVIGVKVPSLFLRDNRTEVARAPVISKQVFIHVRKAKVVKVIGNLCVRDIKTGLNPWAHDE